MGTNSKLQIQRIDLLFFMTIFISMLLMAIIGDWLDTTDARIHLTRLVSGVLLIISLIPFSFSAIGYLYFRRKYGALRFILYALFSIGVAAIGYQAGSRELILLFG